MDENEKTIGQTIDDMGAVMWALLRKLVASEYDSDVEQLRDVTVAGHLAAQIKVMRAARSARDEFYARRGKALLEPQPAPESVGHTAAAKLGGELDL